MIWPNIQHFVSVVHQACKAHPKNALYTSNACKSWKKTSFTVASTLDDSAFFCKKCNGGSAPTVMENEGKLISRQFLWLEYHF
jgi:hypothetical protein